MTNTQKATVLATVDTDDLCRLIVDQRLEEVLIIGPDWCCLHANRAALGASAFSGREVVGRPLAGLIGLDLFRTAVQPSLERCFLGEERRIADCVFSASDDPVRSFLLMSPLRDDRGAVIAVTIMASALSGDGGGAWPSDDADGCFRRLVEEAAIGVAVFQGAQPVFVNRAYTAMLGRDVHGLDAERPGSEGPGASVRPASDPDDDPISAPRDVEIQHKDGHSAWLRHYRRRLDWDGRAATAVVAIDVTEDVEAKLEHERREARFKDFAETASDWFWEQDADHRFVHFHYWNDASFRLARPGLTGKRRIDMALEMDDNWRRHMDDLDNHRPFRNFRYKADDGKGGIMYIASSGRPVFGKGGRFEGYRGTASNITAEVLAKRALERSEARFRDFADIASDWLWEMDGDLRFSYFSERAFELSETDPATVLGKPRSAVVLEMDDNWRAHFDDLEYRRPFRDFRYAKQGGDGRVVHISISGLPIFDEDGRFQGYRGVGTNITRKIEAKEALINERSMLRSIIDNMRTDVFAKDREARFILTNTSCHVREFADGPDDVLGKTDFDYFPEELAEELYQEDMQVIWNGTPLIDKIRASRRGPKKDPRWHSVSKFPLRDAGGGIVGLVGIARDITEAREAEQGYRLFASIVDQVSDHIAIIGTDYRYKAVNHGDVDMLGQASANLVGKHVCDLVGSDRFESVFKSDLDRCFEGETVRARRFLALPDGPRVHVDLNLEPFRNERGRIAGAISIIRDVTDMVQREEQLHLVNAAVEQISDRIAIVDNDLRIRMINRANLTYLGIKEDQILGRHIADLMDKELALHIGPVVQDVLNDGDQRCCRHRTTDRHGQHVHWECMLTAYRDGMGRTAGVMILCRDITEQYLAGEALALSQERFLDFSELAADWFWEWDRDGRFTFLSDSIAALCRRPIGDLLGADAKTVFAQENAKDPVWEAYWQELMSNPRDKDLEAEFDMHAADGTIYRARSSAKPIWNADRELVGYRCAAKDITTAHRLAERLAHQANYDQLTGLMNRRSFERQLRKLLAGEAHARPTAVLCFIDLDQFKIVNDTVGHLVGDILLKQVADLLRAELGCDATLARLGGDEFGLLLQCCSLRRAHRVANRLIAALNQDRFVHEDSVFEIGASIGLAPITRLTRSIGEVMARADLACYAAKDGGRNRVHVYQQKDREFRRRRAEMVQASTIRSALDDGQFMLLGQPIAALSAGGGHDAHYEILLRMLGPDGGLIMPGTFIAAAERYGLMVEIDHWVIERSCAALAEFSERHDGVQMSINLSGLTLNDDKLSRVVRDVLGRFPIRSEQLCFEITETAAIRHLPRTKALITDLRALGCRFALDDFGSGLSSFNYLKELQVDYLKIDGSFIRDIDDDERNRVMVSAIHEVGKCMGIKTVAEGAETIETLDILRDLGIDFAQGYAIGKPRDLREMGALPI